jgi:adenylate kinase family enzyme
MRKYIVMGVQGSGKGTQAKLLADALDLEHISVGDDFRWNVEHHTKLGAQVRRSVAGGELVSDDPVEKVVRRRLNEHDWNYGFIDVCGGQLVARADDSPEAVRARLRDYHAKTLPVLELVRAKEVVLEVDANQPAAEVQAEIRKRLGV